MKRPSRWFLVTIVFLLWVSLYVGKFYFDVSEMTLSDEIHKDGALGFPFPFLKETWTPGSEQMHLSVNFSYFWLIADIVIMAISVFIGWQFGSKMNRKEQVFK